MSTSSASSRKKKETPPTTASSSSTGSPSSLSPASKRDAAIRVMMNRVAIDPSTKKVKEMSRLASTNRDNVIAFRKYIPEKVRMDAIAQHYLARSNSMKLSPIFPAFNVEKVPGRSWTFRLNENKMHTHYDNILPASFEPSKIELIWSSSDSRFPSHVKVLGGNLVKQFSGDKFVEFDKFLSTICENMKVLTAQQLYIDNEWELPYMKTMFLMCVFYELTYVLAKAQWMREKFKVTPTLFTEIPRTPQWDLEFNPHDEEDRQEMVEEGVLIACANASSDVPMSYKIEYFVILMKMLLKADCNTDMIDKIFPNMPKKFLADRSK